MKYSFYVNGRFCAAWFAFNYRFADDRELSFGRAVRDSRRVPFIIANCVSAWAPVPVSCAGTSKIVQRTLSAGIDVPRVIRFHGGFRRIRCLGNIRDQITYNSFQRDNRRRGKRLDRSRGLLDGPHRFGLIKFSNLLDELAGLRRLCKSSTRRYVRAESSH